MSYNMTIIATNTTGMLGFIQGVNDVLMFGWLGVMLLLSIVAISFMAFMVSTNDVRKAVMASSFIAFCCSIFLKAMSLIPNLALFVSLVICAVSVAWSFTQE